MQPVGKAESRPWCGGGTHTVGRRAARRCAAAVSPEGPEPAILPVPTFGADCESTYLMYYYGDDK